jgi:hypothetical protein
MKLHFNASLIVWIVYADFPQQAFMGAAPALILQGIDRHELMIICLQKSSRSTPSLRLDSSSRSTKHRVVSSLTTVPPHK